MNKFRVLSNMILVIRDSFSILYFQCIYSSRFCIFCRLKETPETEVNLGDLVEAPDFGAHVLCVVSIYFRNSCLPTVVFVT